MSIVLTEKRYAIGIITINRPKQLNNLNSEIRTALADACEAFAAVAAG